MNLQPPTDRQARLLWFAVSALAIAIILAVIGAVVWGLGRALQVLSPVLWPLAIAGVVAYLLDPVVDFIERRRVSRPRAIVCVFLLAFILVGGILSAVIPQLVIETNELARRVPDYVHKTRQRLEHFIANPPKIVLLLLQREQAPPPAPAGAVAPLTTPPPEPVSNNAAYGASNSVVSAPANAVVEAANAPSSRAGSSISPETVQKAANWVAGALPQVGRWLFGQVTRVASWFGILAGLALIPVYAFYFLLEKERISSRWTDYLPVRDSNFKTELVFVLTAINNYLIAFFRGQVLVAICDGILYGIGLLAIRVPYAVLIGFAAMFLTIIPYIGAFVICATALLIAIFQFGDWGHPLLVLLVFAIVQLLEGLVISPRIMGNRVGLHPVTIIIAVMAGTTLLGGLLGGILAIPLTAALRVVMFRYVWKRPSPS